MDTTRSRPLGLPRMEGQRQRTPCLFRLHTPGPGPGPGPGEDLRAPLCLRMPRSGQFAIGRGPDLPALCIVPNDHCASRTHALIEVNLSAGSVLVRDANSRNGTFVNGVRLSPQEPRTLRSGDLLRIGDSFFLFRVQAEPADTELPELIGVSEGMVRLRSAVARLAPDRASVLLQGETGTGKDVVAAALHRLSKRPGRRVAVNCAAVPEGLAESQFFGHTRGAFTGATEHAGYFQAARGGTLFLDELGDLPRGVQSKLLRVLEEGVVIPVGSTEPIPHDARVITATNLDLAAEIRAGRFREDLYARLSDVVLTLPPMRERKEDLLLLLAHASVGKPPELSADFVERLLLYDWPRNVREVYKVATHLRLFGPDAELQARLRPAAGPATEPSLAPERGPSLPEKDLPELKEKEKEEPRLRKLAPPQRELLEALMAKHSGVIQEVADELGCSRRQVGRWLELHHIDRARFRPESLGASAGASDFGADPE